MPRLLLALLVAAVACGRTSSTLASNPAGLEAQSCKPCHQKIVDTFIETAHFKTSALATAQSIKGTFADGHAVLRTRSEGIYFRMEKRDGRFYQTGFDSAHRRSRTERFDLVVGSGRRGQSYLYWKDGDLFQLPVSYLTGVEEWINSPGYPDGQIDFGRVIPRRCLECHSTSFQLEIAPGGEAKYSSEYELGISCKTCHGDGQQHVQYQSSHLAEVRAQYILNPARFSRERRLDNCALCHGGARDLRRPSFSYRPGENLDDYLFPPSDWDTPIPDVHGNQIGLLQRSKCFRSSPQMSCLTCHDVHRPQRDLTQLAQKCLGCHQVSEHRMADQIGDRMLSSCIDCHMPNEQSTLIQINTPTKEFSPYYRSHAIGIYPEVTATVLHASKQE